MSTTFGVFEQRDHDSVTSLEIVDRKAAFDISLRHHVGEGKDEAVEGAELSQLSPEQIVDIAVGLMGPPLKQSRDPKAFMRDIILKRVKDMEATTQTP